MKKTFALLVALCLLLTAVSASAAVTPKGQFPIVDEPITLRVAVPVEAKVQDIHTNAYTLFLEETTGIDLEIIELSTSDTATQVNTMMLSGDLPDMFLSYYFSYDELASYVDAGHILNLDPYIEEYGDEYFKYLEETASFFGDASAYVSIDGSVYAVPTSTEMVTGMYGERIRLNEHFLEALNMEMPTTLEGFYDYLVGVRDNDVNGNGDASDEIPLTGHGGNNMLLHSIGGAFQYTDPKNFLKLNAEGEVEFIATNDLFKETVEYLRKLVVEGLLDPAFYTQDQAMMLTLNTQEYEMVGADAAYSSGNYDGTSVLINSLRILPNLVGPNGYSSSYLNLATVARSIVITTACKHPEAAFRLADYLLNEYVSACARLGVENVDWKVAEEGKIGRDGAPAKYELIGTQVWTLASQNQIWRRNGFGHGDTMNGVAEDPTKNAGKLAADIYKYNIPQQVSGENLPDLLMDPETAAEYNELKKLVVDYVKESVAKFVLGDRPMDEWDDYVKTLEAIGIEQYVEMTQDIIDNM